MNAESCLICDKHRGVSHHPPGGIIYKGELFTVCHAPLETGPLGTVFIESNRHLLDYSEMQDDELSAYSTLLGRLYYHLKKLTKAVRIYQVTMLEGIPHFHTWLVPRRTSDPERGVAFLREDFHCELADAEKFASDLQCALNDEASLPV